MSTHIHNIFKTTLCLIVFSTLSVGAQTGNADYLKQLQINQALDPPQNILSTKSLVLISSPTDGAHAEWKKLAEELQAFFAEEGIDVVAYFNTGRQFTVPDFKAEVPALIKNRKVDNLIFVIMGKEDEESIIGFGPYNGKDTFYDQSATFWARVFTKPEQVFDQMRNLFKTGAFPRTNLLVNESPEFFDLTKPSFAANYASFPPELQTRKIGIPTLRNLPSGAGSHLLNSDHFFNPEENAIKVAKRNAAFQAVMSDSLFDMQRIDLRAKTEALLRRDGFTHILYFVEGDSEYIYSLFRYKNRQEITSNKLVKFFLKDLRNRNVFLGRTWDANADWQLALDSFIAQMVKELPGSGG